MDFVTLERNLRQLDIDKLVVKAALMHEAEIVDLNTSQLLSGKLSTGKSLSPKYSKSYAQLKKSIGSKSSPTPDLFLEGNFQEGFYLSDNNTGILIFDSKDEKTQKLERKYSIDIFGLTDKNWNEVTNDIIFEDLKKLIYERITED